MFKFIITIIIAFISVSVSGEEEEEISFTDNTLDHCNEVVDSYVTRFLNSAHGGEENHYQGFWYCKNCGKGNVGLSDKCSKCGQPR